MDQPGEVIWLIRTLQRYSLRASTRRAPLDCIIWGCFGTDAWAIAHTWSAKSYWQHWLLCLPTPPVKCLSFSMMSRQSTEPPLAFLSHARHFIAQFLGHPQIPNMWLVKFILRSITIVTERLRSEGNCWLDHCGEVIVPSLWLSFAEEQLRNPCSTDTLVPFPPWAENRYGVSRSFAANTILWFFFEMGTSALSACAPYIHLQIHNLYHSPASLKLNGHGASLDGPHFVLAYYVTTP